MNIFERSAYLLLCASTIALFVFLNATQPFVLTSVFGRSKAGTIVSHLALADELINILCAPLWGALSDKIGTRYVAVAGLALLGASTAFYPRAGGIYPQLLLLRVLFACGGSAAISMITAILSEYSRTQRGGHYLSAAGGSDETPTLGNPGEVPIVAEDLDADFSMLADGTGSAAEDEEGAAVQTLFSGRKRAPRGRGNGTMAGLVGLASGLGAIFAVAALLPLPTRLGYADHPVEAIQKAYLIVGVGAGVIAVALFFTLHQDRTKGLGPWLRGDSTASVFDEAAYDRDAVAQHSYWALLKKGFVAARGDRELQLAYYGSAVARSVSIVISLFIPLYVNDWYLRTGRCDETGRVGCHDGYVRSEILTGIANTATLVGAPAVGWAIDRFPTRRVLAASGVLGALTMGGFVFAPTALGPLPIVLAVFAGAASIGVMTESMAMAANGRREFAGSISGVYSLCGGLGILAVTQVGGPLADVWIKAPFAVMAVLFVGLIAGYR